jgi:glycosyltransferase involved in cell wall biosynthesis
MEHEIMNDTSVERLKRKIRVCHIITKMVYGGASIGTLHLVQKLSSRGFENTIICGRQSSNEGDLLSNAADGAFETTIIPELVREINPLMDLRAFCALAHEFKRKKFDIVHVHGSKAGVIGRLAASVCGVPIILYTVHGWGLKAGGLLVRVIFRTIERALARVTTALLFQTESDKNEASQYEIGENSQHYLIGNGIDLKPFINCDVRTARKIRRDLGLENKKVIGAVGRVSAQKNPTGFFNIARQIVEQNKDVVFIFAGGGEMLDKMRKLVHRARLQRNVLFLGVRNDIPELVSNFDIVILPSLWEGMPRSIIEAMALSKPVIAYDIAGIREIIDDGVNGLIIPLNHITEFVHGIRFLLENPEISRTMGQKGKRAVRKYNFNNVVKKTETLYTQLFSRFNYKVLDQ